MMRLRRLFRIAEATPFSSQTAQGSFSYSMGTGHLPDGSQTKVGLQAAEKALRKVMASDQNPQLGKLINQFLVDIASYLE